MIAKWSEVVCDSCKTGSHAMPTAEESRQCAKDDGWIRRKELRFDEEGQPVMKSFDLCLRCKS